MKIKRCGNEVREQPQYLLQAHVTVYYSNLIYLFNNINSLVTIWNLIQEISQWCYIISIVSPKSEWSIRNLTKWYLTHLVQLSSLECYLNWPLNLMGKLCEWHWHDGVNFICIYLITVLKQFKKKILEMLNLKDDWVHTWQ